jgi:SAM-dependent methyltransferase
LRTCHWLGYPHADFHHADFQPASWRRIGLASPVITDTPMELTPSQRKWMEGMQVEWARVMKPFSIDDGWSDQYIKRGRAFTPIPKLAAKHLVNAKLVPSREEILAELPKGGIGAEVGTQHGYFARKLLDTVQPRELHLFDLSFDGFDKAGYLQRSDVVKTHQGDSANLLARFPAGSFDWIYIDADHRYEGVKRDIAVAKRVIKEDGLLMFNDFTYWSPLEAFDYGVAHAVCELCLDDDWEIVLFALEPWMYCDVALRRCRKA